METVIFLFAVGVILFVADRFAGDGRAVEKSEAYREACTGMIREPQAPPNATIEPRAGKGMLANAGTVSKPEPVPTAAVHPT